MDKKKDYNHFPIRETVMISGNIIQKNKASAKSDFRKDIAQLLGANGYQTIFVPERKIATRTSE
jgi:hypothetical protein